MSIILIFSWEKRVEKIVVEKEKNIFLSISIDDGSRAISAFGYF